MQGSQGCHPWVAVPRAASGPRPGLGRRSRATAARSAKTERSPANRFKDNSCQRTKKRPQDRKRQPPPDRRPKGQDPAGAGRFRPPSRRHSVSPQDERNLTKTRRLGEPMTGSVKNGSWANRAGQGPPPLPSAVWTGQIPRFRLFSHLFSGSETPLAIFSRRHWMPPDRKEKEHS